MNRSTTYDTLRSAAMALVVLLHVSAPYVTHAASFTDVSFWTGNLIDSFSRVCVPVFVMLSGRFLLLGHHHGIEFLRRRLGKIAIPLIAWTVFYVVLVEFEGLNRTGLLSWGPLRAVLFGSPYYHLWYLYMLVGLYLATPLLNRALVGLSPKRLISLGVLLLVIGMGLSAWNLHFKNTVPFPFWFIDYLGYYILGYALPLVVVGRNKLALTSLVCYLASSLSIAVASYLTLQVSGSLYFYTYLSPLVAVASLSFYTVFVAKEIRVGILAHFAPYSLGIYLVHVLVLKYVNVLVPDIGLAIIEIALKWCLTFAGSYLVARMISLIPFLRRTI